MTGFDFWAICLRGSVDSAREAIGQTHINGTWSNWDDYAAELVRLAFEELRADVPGAFDTEENVMFVRQELAEMVAGMRPELLASMREE